MTTAMSIESTDSFHSCQNKNQNYRAEINLFFEKGTHKQKSKYSNMQNKIINL